MDTMTTLSTATGLGAAALNYVREDPQREAAFLAWFSAQDSVRHEITADSSTSRVLECAAITCAGVSKMFADAA